MFIIIYFKINTNTVDKIKEWADEHSLRFAGFMLNDSERFEYTEEWNREMYSCVFKRDSYKYALFFMNDRTSDDMDILRDIDLGSRVIRIAVYQTKVVEKDGYICVRDFDFDIDKSPFEPNYEEAEDISHLDPNCIPQYSVNDRGISRAILHFSLAYGVNFVNIRRIYPYVNQIAPIDIITVKIIYT